VQTKPADLEDALENEAGKGYSIAFVGIEDPISSSANRLADRIQRLVGAFNGPLALVLNGGRSTSRPGAPLRILVPTGGTPEARLAMEVAMALAGASGGELTALHVFDPQDDVAMMRGGARRRGLSVLVDARRLGKRSGVEVQGVTVTNARPIAAIRRAVRVGRHDLVVIGTSLRQGDGKFLGPRAATLVRALHSPILLIAK